MKKLYTLALILLMGCGGESDPDPVEEKLNYTITVSAGEGGSVNTLGGTYPEGTALTITATPDAEYLFDGWSGTEISTSNPLNIILTGNESVVANFVKKQYDLALSIEGEGTVEEVVTKAGKEYASGTEVELTAIPAEGWMFNGWTGDLETIDNPVNITIDEAKSVTANFIRKTYELTVNIEGEGTVAEEVVVAPSQYEFETQVELTANPAEGWEFSNWSGAVEGTDNPVTIEINDAKEVTAVFTRKIYDLNVSIEGEGTVDEEVVVAPSQYEFETQVKLTANHAEFYKFVAWSGYLETTDNPITVLVDQGISLTATFELKDTDGDGVTDDIDQCPDTPAGVVIDENGCQIPPIYLAENGVTVKARDFAQVSDTWEINGAEYTVVDETTLRQMVENGEDVERVVTSKVTAMNELFYKKSGFNADLSSWDVSSVINMASMFNEANSFNQDLSSWNVASVNNMSGMFYAAGSFNSDLSDWDVSSVNNMAFTFDGANSFNSDLSTWNVSNVTSMNYMFHRASSFNADLSSWDVSSVNNMESMFNKANSFNANLSTWDVSSVNNMVSMFNEANSFNQDLSSWNVASVNNMSGMFYAAISFKSDLSSWDVSSVNNMTFMFDGASSFDSDLSAWNVSNVTSMNYMFHRASSFNQDLSKWCVPLIKNEPSNFAVNATAWVLSKPRWGTCPLEDDTDGDGVVDYYDQCPDTAVGTIVNQNGCDSGFYIDPNNVTIRCENANIGDVATINGKTYKVTSDQNLISDRDAYLLDGNPNTCLCTSKLTSLYGSEKIGRDIVDFNIEDITDWDVSNVGSMYGTFWGTKTNPNLEYWDVGKVTNMSYLFWEATYFNSDISNWDVKSVTGMEGMFGKASFFNQDISNWNTLNVRQMRFMFESASNFNQNIGNWDVSSVLRFNRMFGGNTIFNQDLSNWDVSNASEMDSMFNSATSFNQDLSNWNVDNITLCSGFSDGASAWTLPKPNFTNCNPN